MANEAAGGDLLQIEDGIEPLGVALWEFIGGKKGDGHNVFSACPREVRGDGAIGAVQRGYRPMHELQVARVLKPLHAMIRLQHEWPICRIAVGVKNVDLAVAIEVDELNAAGAVSGVGGFVE